MPPLVRREGREGIRALEIAGTTALLDLDRVLNRPTDDGRVTTLPSVELGVLGPLQVRQYGAPVAIPGAKPRAILTMLGLHGGSVVSADTLVELLWGDDPPRTAAKALQTHISSLRRTPRRRLRGDRGSRLDPGRDRD